jgi:hypothetical protein
MADEKQTGQQEFTVKAYGTVTPPPPPDENEEDE